MALPRTGGSNRLSAVWRRQFSSSRCCMSPDPFSWRLPPRRALVWPSGGAAARMPKLSRCMTLSSHFRSLHDGFVEGLGVRQARAVALCQRRALSDDLRPTGSNWLEGAWRRDRRPDRRSLRRDLAGWLRAEHRRPAEQLDGFRRPRLHLRHARPARGGRLQRASSSCRSLSRTARGFCGPIARSAASCAASWSCAASRAC